MGKTFVCDTCVSGLITDKNSELLKKWINSKSESDPNLRNWKLAFGGKSLQKEWSSGELRAIISFLERSDKLHIVRQSAIDLALGGDLSQFRFESNDAEIIALVYVASVKIIATCDRDLKTDIKVLRRNHARNVVVVSNGQDLLRQMRSSGRRN